MKRRPRMIGGKPTRKKAPGRKPGDGGRAAVKFAKDPDNLRLAIMNAMFRPEVFLLPSPPDFEGYGAPISMTDAATTAVTITMRDNKLIAVRRSRGGFRVWTQQVQDMVRKGKTDSARGEIAKLVRKYQIFEQREKQSLDLAGQIIAKGIFQIWIYAASGRVMVPASLLHVAKGLDDDILVWLNLKACAEKAHEVCGLDCGELYGAFLYLLRNIAALLRFKQVQDRAGRAIKDDQDYRLDLVSGQVFVIKR